jgi:competence protein ComEC
VDSLNQMLLWMAALPGASIEGLHPTLLQVSMVYVVIAAVYLLVDRFRLRGTIKSGRGW